MHIGKLAAALTASNRYDCYHHAENLPCADKTSKPFEKDESYAVHLSCAMIRISWR